MEKNITLNIDVKIPDDIKSGLDTIEQKIDAIIIPEQKDYTEQFQSIVDKLNEEEEIIVKLNII